MLTFVFAVMSAWANATSSVLQRVANRDVSEHDQGWRLIVELVRRPVWLSGVATLAAGFILQAAALSRGALAVVEPVLVLELPISLLIAGLVFHGRLRRREWAAVLAITAGLGGLLYFLAPSGDVDSSVSARVWLIGVAINVGFMAALALAAGAGSRSRRAALLGIAAGSGFGLAAALMKAMTENLADGIDRLLVSWQTYAMIGAGLLGMLFLQGALHAGSLVAAQPGVTTADPIVSILWGTLGFGESVRSGPFLVLACGSAILIGAGVFVLTRSPLLTDGTSAGRALPDEG